MCVWKDAHFALLCIVKWVGRTEPKGVASSTWQQLMEMLRDYFNSMSTEGDTRVSMQEAEQMDVEVGILPLVPVVVGSSVTCVQIVEAIQNHLIPVVAKGGAGHVTRILSGLLSQGSSRVSDDPLKGEWVDFMLSPATPSPTTPSATPSAATPSPAVPSPATPSPATL